MSPSYETMVKRLKCHFCEREILLNLCFDIQ